MLESQIAVSGPVVLVLFFSNFVSMAWATNLGGTRLGVKKPTTICGVGKIFRILFPAKIRVDSSTPESTF